MIGFYFVVKKNSWNILVKSARPPDYTLKTLKYTERTVNIHRIFGTFYTAALQWIASEFFLVNIKFFLTYCNYFYIILQILHCDNATGLSSGESCSVVITES